VSEPRGQASQPDIVLAFDFGERRIGVAVASTAAGTAGAAGTLAARAGEPDWAGLDRLLAEWQPARLVIGLPYNADGSESAMTAKARRFGAALAQRYALPLAWVDERYTSTDAEQRLREERASGRRRRLRKQDIDQQAAILIAQSWLRSTGREPGGQ